MKFQYMNGLSPTHSNDLLNALLECIKFYLYIHIVFLLTYRTRKKFRVIIFRGISKN